MGLYSSSRRSSSSYDYPASVPAQGNPNPKKYVLHTEVRYTNALLVEISYPDCTNFEGRKILVYRTKKTFAEIEKNNKGSIDPHFSDNTTFISPFARFEPSAEGMGYAMAFARNLK